MQIHRLVAMIYLLLERKRMTAKELAEHFEVSTRTVYRDVEALSQSGIPIYASKGQGGGISLTEQFVLNKSVLTVEERQGVLSALQGLHAVQAGEAKAALEKLSALLGGQQEDWIEVDFSSWGGNNRIDQRFALLRQAIFDRQLVSFHYDASGQAGAWRVVEPMKLVCRGHDWYLLGWCRLREDHRYFKLSRMAELTLTAEHFERRSLPQAQPGETETALEGPMVELSLRLRPEMVYRLRDDFGQLSVQEAADGWQQVKVETPWGEWLYPYLLAYGDMLEVLAPEAVREEMISRLQKAWQRYQI